MHENVYQNELIIYIIFIRLVKYCSSIFQKIPQNSEKTMKNLIFFKILYTIE